MSIPGTVMDEDLVDATWSDWRRQKQVLEDAMAQHFMFQEAVLARLLQEPAVTQRRSSKQRPLASEPESHSPVERGESFALAPALRQSSTRPSELGAHSPLERSESFALAPAFRKSLTIKGSSLESQMTTVVPSPSDGAASSREASPTSSGPARETKNFKQRKQRNKLKFLGGNTRTQQLPKATRFEGNIIVRSVKSVIDWWMMLEEPPRSGLLHFIVRHRYFEAFVAAVIVANTIYTTYQANYEMRTLGQKPHGDMWVETSFLCVFLLELAGKFAVHRLYMFCNNDMTWNIFDCTLVLFSTIDQVVSYGGASMGSVSFARSLRLFKMGKILRVFRAFRFLKELRVMMNSIMGSFLSLFWSIITLGMILFVFALFFMQQMTNYLVMADREQDPALWESQRFYFSNVERSIATLSMCTTGGKDWEEVWVLIQPLGAFSALAFSFYIAFFTFAVMNILTGIFVDSALQLCKPDDHEALCDHQKKVQKEMDELAVIMEIMDVNSSGTLSMEEFTSAMANDRVTHAMLSLGVDIKDADLFFRTLATMNDSEEVSVEDFAMQVIRMKGAASSVDLHGLILQTVGLQKSVNKLREMQEELSHSMSAINGSLRASWRNMACSGSPGESPMHSKDRSFPPPSGGTAPASAEPSGLWCAPRESSRGEGGRYPPGVVAPLMPPEEDEPVPLPTRVSSRGAGCLD